MRLAKIVPYVVVGWCIALMAYGFVQFPDAPYKACEPGPYCGKSHRPHTVADYDALQRWQLTIFSSWPFGMVGGFVIRRRRKAASSD